MLHWAHAEGEVGDVRPNLPKLGRRDIEVLSRAELERIEDAAKSERDKLIIRVLADTGIRVGELVSLRTTNLVERDRRWYLRVRGKGDRDRLVPVPQLARRLQRFIRSRPADACSDRMFLGLKRRAGRPDLKPLTVSGVQQMIRNAARVAHVDKRVHPHPVRHSFATWQINRDVNPMQLADILGHSSLLMIQRVYTPPKSE